MLGASAAAGSRRTWRAGSAASRWGVPSGAVLVGLCLVLLPGRAAAGEGDRLPECIAQGRLRTGCTIHQDRLVLPAGFELLTDGHDLTVDVEELAVGEAGGEARIVTFREGPATPPAPPPREQIGREGEDGATGLAGRPGGTIRIRARRASGRLTVRAVGEPGGAGGEGGRGGPGFPGERGQDARSQFFYCEAGGQQGRVGGPGGKAGAGGAGGPGGAGGQIVVEIRERSPGFHLHYSVAGGPGGPGGASGPGGSGGPGGQGGSGSGLCGGGPPGPWGPAGPINSDGKRGPHGADGVLTVTRQPVLAEAIDDVQK
jgi:hypothetical protein